MGRKSEFTPEQRTQLVLKLLSKDGFENDSFELGGTSLTGVQLVSELKKEFNVDVPVVSIFEAPTVTALARYLGRNQDREAAFERNQDRVEKKKQALEARRQKGNRRSL